LSNVLIPLNKNNIHKKLELLLSNLQNTLTKMVHFGESLNVSLLENEFANYQELLGKVKKFEEIYLLSEL